MWDIGVMRSSSPKCVPEEGYPPQRLSWVPAAMLGCDQAPPWFALRRGVKWYPGSRGPKGKGLSFPVSHAYSPACLWEYVLSNPLGTSMRWILSLTFPIDQIDLKFE